MNSIRTAAALAAYASNAASLATPKQVLPRASNAPSSLAGQVSPQFSTFSVILAAKMATVAPKREAGPAPEKGNTHYR